MWDTKGVAVGCFFFGIICMGFIMLITETNKPKTEDVEIVIRENQYQIHRVYINGIPYLVNTKGGIVKEGFAGVEE